MNYRRVQTASNSEVQLRLFSECQTSGVSPPTRGFPLRPGLRSSDEARNDCQLDGPKCLYAATRSFASAVKDINHTSVFQGSFHGKPGFA